MSRKSDKLLLAVAACATLAAGCARTEGPGVARGQQIYDTCVPCHGRDGLGSVTVRAPQIAGLPKWYLVAQLTKFKEGMRGAHPDDMEGARMRPMAKTLYRAGDLESVAEYVSRLKPARPMATVHGGDAAAGQTRFMSLCMACHGPTASGNQALGAPPLDHQADWYMLAQLGKFRDRQRGAHPGDVSGAQMMAMANTLPDTTAMRDVVTFIRTLQK